MIITNSRYALLGYFITSYPTRAHGIIVIYFFPSGHGNKFCVGFFFLYGYGAPLGGPSGRPSSAINKKNSRGGSAGRSFLKKFFLIRENVFSKFPQVFPAAFYLLYYSR